MSVINYAVEIITEQTAFTNTAYGLQAGTFRYITGRPQYDGSTVVPKNEDGSDNTHVWYEGWLMRDKLSNPTRSADLSQTGDYATMSGFNFSIRNDVKLWVYIRDNAIYLTNRTVHFYVVIDGVFHPAWSGVVANNPYDDINYEFLCQDPFKRLHKMIPPIVIDETSFPGSSTDSQGTPISVVIGDCTYAKLTVISNEPANDTLILSRINPDESFEIKACGAKSYKANGLTHPTLELYTKDVSYVADALKDHYCYAAKGGGSIDSDILIKIASNDATTVSGITKIYLEAPFEFTTEEIFNQKYSYEPRQGYDLQLVNINASSCTSYTDAQIGQFGEMWDIRSGAMLTYEHLDMSNNGAGCNQLLFEASANEARRIKVHLGTSTGRIIGEVPIPKDNEYKWYTCDIEKQYGTDVKITLEFYLGNAKYHGYVNKLNKIKMTHNKSDIDTWFFSTIYMPYTHVISTAGIKEIVSDAAGPMVFIYNDKTLQMEQVSGIVLDTVVSTTGSMGHPQMGLYTSRMKKDGAVVYLVPIVPRKWEIFLDRTDNGYIKLDSGDTTRHITDLSKSINGFDLCDRKQDNYCRLYFPDYEDAIKNTYKFSFRVSFPPEHLLVEYDSVYLGFDMLAIATEVGTKIRMFAEYKMLDPYGNPVDMLNNGDPDPTVFWPLDETVQSDHVGFDSLPNEYYANGGSRIIYDQVLWPYVGYDGNGEESSIKGLLKLSDDIVGALRDGTTTNVIQVNVWITSTGAQKKDEFGNPVTPSPNGVPFHLTVGLKEAGFVGYRAINPSSDDFYVRVKGETIDGLESNTVYQAFRLLLESYDKIPGSMIDYTNLPYCRDDWNCGRQISDRKSSFDYISELANQSFVVVYGTRDGKRGLRAWRDPYMKQVAGVWTDQEPTKLSLPVIVDSIQWENTEMADLYNDFRIWYDYNEATGKYQCSIVVTNADQEAFPEIGEMAPAPTSMEKWKTWVGGIGGGSYADAKQIWDTIAESYRRTWAIQPLPDNLSKLSWFPNNMLFLGLTNAVLDTKDSPYKFMDNCIRWVTRQKAKVVFQTPLTGSSIVAELLRTVEFTDPLYTNAGTRTGWISGIEIDTKKDVMKLTYILEPEDIIIDNLIIERGKLLNVNTHVETGTQVDQVKDGQNRT